MEIQLRRMMRSISLYITRIMNMKSCMEIVSAARTTSIIFMAMIGTAMIPISRSGQASIRPGIIRVIIMVPAFLFHSPGDRVARIITTASTIRSMIPFMTTTGIATVTGGMLFDIRTTIDMETSDTFMTKTEMIEMFDTPQEVLVPIV